MKWTVADTYCDKQNSYLQTLSSDTKNNKVPASNQPFRLRSKLLRSNCTVNYNKIARNYAQIFRIRTRRYDQNSRLVSA